ncbi:hypothetical protein [Arsenicicoccus cauae]|nr:hypothetical protein [Arsenicicoccus cauae]
MTTGLKMARKLQATAEHAAAWTKAAVNGPGDMLDQMWSAASKGR